MYHMMADHFNIGRKLEISEVYFRLLCANGFHVKVGMKDFISAGFRCRQNFKFEIKISRRHSVDCIIKRAWHVQHDYFASFNQ